MSEPLVIVGAGGHGRETALTYLTDHPDSSFLGFLDDGNARATPEGWPIIGRIDEWCDSRGARFAIAINDSRARRSVVARMRSQGEPTWATITHPAVRLHSSVTHGAGCMFLGDCQVTTNIRLGDFCIINRGSHLSHDCVLGSYISLNPCSCIAGRVRIEDGCEIGSGAAIKQGVVIGAGSTVGLGSAVIANVERCSIVGGTPSRHLKDAAPW